MQNVLHKSILILDKFLKSKYFLFHIITEERVKWLGGWKVKKRQEQWKAPTSYP